MRIFLDTIGCRLNQSEIEKMAAQFKAAGHMLVADAAEADLVVVNTCAVTKAAASDSRQAIRQAARAGGAQVVATGCWATLDPLNAAKLPSVSKVINNEDKDGLVSAVLNISSTEIEPEERQRVPGEHSRTRAFIKVQDGCDNACTFCITRVARGRSRSRLSSDVIEDVNLAMAGGTREVVLTGVQLGSWGKDLSPRVHLRDLVEAILAQTSVPRLRLSSIEPWDLDRSFFSLWADQRLCPHLHLPLQSGSASILKRMARKITPERYELLVNQAREIIPEVAITTDLIVGFPGETEIELAESTAFVRRMQFAGGHVFHFSPRPGTPAARFAQQVPARVGKQRSNQMRAVFNETARGYQQLFLGRQMQVLWEMAQQQSDQSWLMEGLTGNYLRVKAHSGRNLWNQISLVKLETIEGELLAGSVLDESMNSTTSGINSGC